MANNYEGMIYQKQGFGGVASGLGLFNGKECLAFQQMGRFIKKKIVISLFLVYPINNNIFWDIVVSPRLKKWRHMIDYGVIWWAMMLEKKKLILI